MRIFISHSSKDKKAVSRIAARLKKDGHDVWADYLKLSPGDNFADKIQEAIRDSEAFVVVISANSLQSTWARAEFSAIALGQIADKKKVVPVRIDNCPVPNYLSNFLYVDLSHDFQSGLETLSQVFKVPKRRSKSVAEPQRRGLQSSLNAKLGRLHDHLREGRLTLVCGASVSVEAGVPTWGALLIRLLESMMEQISKHRKLNINKQAATEFQRRYGSSSLILGKYLKNNLGRDFSKQVRDALYSESSRSCSFIDS